MGLPCQCTTGVNGQQVCPGLEIAANNATYVPATGTDFVGELKCYQTTSDGAPVAGNSLKGEATLTDAQATDLKDGKMYFNVHTAANKGGEIRGQMMKK